MHDSKLRDFVDWLDQQLEFHHDASRDADVWARKRASERFDQFAHVRRAVHEYLASRNAGQANQSQPRT
jgi:hypothetical protein